MTVLTYIAAFLTGLLSAMGVGGGMILILWLSVFCGMAQLDVQGINLIFFIPIALLAVIAHAKSGLIHIKAILPAVITGVIGAVLGVYAAEYIGSPLLRKVFAVFILIIGLKSLFCKSKPNEK